MDFGKAFSFPFEDQDWIKKLGIIALLSIIPVFGTFVLMGWALEVTRRVIQRDPQPLPDASDFGKYFMNGLKVFVIALVYALPIILLASCGGIGSIALGQEGGDNASSFAGLLYVCLSCLFLPYTILLGLVFPAAIGRFAATGEMGTAFRFGEVFGLVRKAPSAYIMVLLVSMLVGLISSMLGSVLCLIGLLFTTAYAAVINAHMQGQAYNQAGSNHILGQSF